jgi:hypothetical protein
MTMLIQAIEAYNETASRKIELKPTRDGRVTAILPHLGKEALGQGNITHTREVTADDIALVCREARLAMGPALALLDAALEQEPAAPVQT